MGDLAHRLVWTLGRRAGDDRIPVIGPQEIDRVLGEKLVWMSNQHLQQGGDVGRAEDRGQRREGRTPRVNGR